MTKFKSNSELLVYSLLSCTLEGVLQWGYSNPSEFSGKGFEITTPENNLLIYDNGNKSVQIVIDNLYCSLDISNYNNEDLWIELKSEIVSQIKRRDKSNTLYIKKLIECIE